MATRYKYFTRYIILLPYSLLVTNYSFPKSNLSYITAPQKVARYITYPVSIRPAAGCKYFLTIRPALSVLHSSGGLAARVGAQAGLPRPGR